MMKASQVAVVVSDFLSARTPRERGLLGLGLGAAAIYLALGVVWLPLQDQRRLLAGRIAHAEQAMAVLARLPDPDWTAQPADPRAINVILTETAADFGIAIRRLEPEGQSAALTLDEVGFEPLVLWLDALEQDAGLRLSMIELTRRPVPGVVSARLLLERPRP